MPREELLLDQLGNLKNLLKNKHPIPIKDHHGKNGEGGITQLFSQSLDMPSVLQERIVKPVFHFSVI